MKITAETILEELYQTDIENLVKLDKLVSEKGLKWYNLFYIDDALWTLFTDYIIKKYKLSPRKYWRDEINFVIMDYGPTSNKELHEETINKVKDDPEIQQLLSKIKLVTIQDLNERLSKSKPKRKKR